MMEFEVTTNKTVHTIRAGAPLFVVRHETGTITVITQDSIKDNVVLEFMSDGDAAKVARDILALVGKEEA